ncbi:hypothetical protein ACIRG5_24355 [Lentzea sp. NPDC102401]|uniref:hypothetical protein n=1 Tax=Lentzea sp. NPDC102401 TaxID=3364128 RepID=UPI0038005E44
MTVPIGHSNVVGSESAQQAARQAAWEAARRSAELHAELPARRCTGHDREGARRAARRGDGWVCQSVAGALEVAPELDITYRVEVDTPAWLLDQESAGQGWSSSA